MDDLDLDGGLLRVEEGKGGRDRIVPVGRHAVEWLRKWLAIRPRLVRNDHHGRVFVSKSGLPLDGPSVRDVVRRWAKAAGSTKSLSSHALRRACATELVRNGAPIASVKEILGHEDFSSMDSYVRLVVGDLKKALAAHHPREKSEG